MRADRRIFVALGLAAGASLVVPAPASASPQDLFGYGPRSQSMGMTGASYSSGFESVYSNPAGLTSTPGNQLALGFTANLFRLQIDGAASPEPASRGIVIGLGLPLPFGGPLRDVLYVGAGFFTPTNTVMQAEAPYPERSQWLVLSRSQVVAVQLALGVNLGRWVDGLSLGIGVSGAAGTVGKILAGLDAANQFVSRTETQLTSRFAPIVGVRYTREHFAIGVTYHAAVQSEINMNVVVTDLPVAIPRLTLNALAQYDPHAVMAEASYLPTPNLRIVLGAYYRHWSSYTGRLTKTSEGSNTPAQPGFRDTVSPRAGVEWNHPMGRTSVAVRGGYAFEPTPAHAARIEPVLDSAGHPTSGATAPVRYIDSHRHALSAGFGLVYRLSGDDPMSFSFDLQTNLQIVQQRTHDIPATDDPMTGMPVPGDPPMVTQGLIPGAGLVVGASW